MTDYPIFRKGNSPIGPTRVYWTSVMVRFKAAHITWPHLCTLLGRPKTGGTWWGGSAYPPSVEEIEKMAAILGCHTRDLCAPPMLGTKLPPYPWPQFTDEVIEQNGMVRLFNGRALQVRRKLMMIPPTALARASGVMGFGWSKIPRIHYIVEKWERRRKLDEMTPTNLRLMAENLWCTPLDLCMRPNLDGRRSRKQFALPHGIPTTLPSAEPLVAGDDGLDLGGTAEVREVRDTTGLPTEGSGEAVGGQAGDAGLAVQTGQEGLGSGEIGTKEGDAGLDGRDEGAIHTENDRQSIESLSSLLRETGQYGKTPGVVGRPRMPRTGREAQALAEANRHHTKTFLAEYLCVPRSRLVDWFRDEGTMSPDELEKIEELNAATELARQKEQPPLAPPLNRTRRMRKK